MPAHARASHACLKPLNLNPACVFQRHRARAEITRPEKQEVVPAPRHRLLCVQACLFPKHTRQACLPHQSSQEHERADSTAPASHRACARKRGSSPGRWAWHVRARPSSSTRAQPRLRSVASNLCKFRPGPFLYFWSFSKALLLIHTRMTHAY